MSYCPSCGDEFEGIVTCPNDGAPLTQNVGDPMIGLTLDGKFEVQEKIGAGGMGVVYRGTQSPLGRTVAIKTMPAQAARDPVSLRRFLREAQILSRLSHPNIVQVYDAGQTEDAIPFLVMEYLEGEELESLARRNRGLPFDQVRQIMRDICAGVDEAHRGGLIHRDLKPSNILLAQQRDGTTQAKILDFGLARPTHWEGTMVTQAGIVLGTPGYVSPEQLLRSAEPDARSDLYALGGILYYAMVGRPAFPGADLQEIIVRQLAGPPGRIDQSAQPAGLYEVVCKATAKEPEQRDSDGGFSITGRPNSPPWSAPPE